MNLLVDTVAAARLTAMVGTGYILWFALPPGTNRTHSLWGLLRHQFGAVHFWISVSPPAPRGSNVPARRLLRPRVPEARQSRRNNSLAISDSTGRRQLSMPHEPRRMGRHLPQ